MPARRLLFGLLAGVAFAAAPLRAATLDVPTPYVPSTQANVDEMLRLADVRESDVVYDLGSGDGRVVISAARDWGARGVGIEIDPKLVSESIEHAKREGVAERVAFRQGDVLKAPIANATVVTMYLLTPLVEKLKPRLLKELAPGTRIVAHEYGFSDWKPDRHVHISKNFYLYVVPAPAGGKWQLSVALPDGTREYDLEFAQRYQALRGGARVAGGYLPAFEAHLNGDRIEFVLVDDHRSYRYRGRVSSNEITGTVHWGSGPKQQQSTWRATRVMGLSDG